MRERAKLAATLLALPALALVIVILNRSAAASGAADGKWVAAAVLAGIAGLLLALSLGFARRDRDGFAFAATAIAIVSTVAAFFVGLYPSVLVSSSKPAYNLTVFSASSSHHTLALMAIVALIFTPIVLLYQGWTYWVFRARLRGDSLPGGDLLGGSDGRPTP